jgi:3-hydroxyacyl-[acyl-carrier-protein] dehydratase
MLLNNFYFIRQQEIGDRFVKARLEFDANHPIFRGHFPSVPVVPGVCMMQIVREVLETITGNNVRLTRVPVMKFLSLINPTLAPTVQLDLSYIDIADTGYQVTASLLNEAIIYFKFKGVATIVAR